MSTDKTSLQPETCNVLSSQKWHFEESTPGLSTQTLMRNTRLLLPCKSCRIALSPPSLIVNSARSYRKDNNTAIGYSSASKAFRETGVHVTAGRQAADQIRSEVWLLSFYTQLQHDKTTQ